MRFLSILLTGLTLPGLAAAQTPEASPAAIPATTITVGTKLVNLPVVVRDKKGALIQNLTKDDFALQVDGHPQTVRYFDKDTNLPLTLGLLVDSSESQRPFIDDERAASSAFIDQMVASAKDKAFIIQFAKSVELLEDATSSRPKLQAAIKSIGDPIPNQSADSDDNDSSNSGNGSGNSGNGNSGGNGRNNGNNGNGSRRRYSGGTTLYDSLFLAADELMSKQTGRKAIIILSDGNDRGSKESLAKSIEAAQRSDTIVYAIFFKGEQRRDNFNDSNRQPGGGYPGGGYPGRYPGGGYPGNGYPGGYPGNDPYPPGGGGRNGSTSGDGKKVLDRIAHETGGRLFEVSKKLTADQIYTQIAEELHAQYRLGYTPDAAGSAEGYHKVDLALSNSHEKNLIVQTREGYYAGK